MEYDTNLFAQDQKGSGAPGDSNSITLAVRSGVLMRRSVPGKYNRADDNENCDRKPDPSPDILPTVESQKFTYTVQLPVRQFHMDGYREKKRIAIPKNL